MERKEEGKAKKKRNNDIEKPRTKTRMTDRKKTRTEARRE